MNLERLEALIGEDILKVKNLNILIVGIGGVGGYVFESLVRMGVEHITIIDSDKIEESNLNRQIISNQSNIGEVKVKEAKKRAISINPSICVNDLCMFLDSSNIDLVNYNEYDYVIDCCDTVDTKVLIINECLKENVKIVSSMGTAKKMDASKLLITSLDKTSYDPLAKKLRHLVDKKLQKKVTVVSSTEEVKEISVLGSNSYVPAVAGLLITNYIINDVLS